MPSASVDTDPQGSLKPENKCDGVSMTVDYPRTWMLVFGLFTSRKIESRERNATELAGWSKKFKSTQISTLNLVRVQVRDQIKNGLHVFSPRPSVGWGPKIKQRSCEETHLPNSHHTSWKLNVITVKNFFFFTTVWQNLIQNIKMWFKAMLVLLRGFRMATVWPCKDSLFWHYFLIGTVFKSNFICSQFLSLQKYFTKMTGVAL